ncbi:immunity 49 family protein [Streptomyces sp. NPDC088719]|uniref:immunity 49 family protein n=1 Tax=Streptomyces sp. NPDC088719 TaxID=3365872 RepID=UPI0038299FDA
MSGAVVSAAREDFVNRIGGQVRSLSKGVRMATYEWQSIADEFLDYLGALSVDTPDLDTAEAAAALKDASEAAAGAVAYAAYHPHCAFQISLDYVNFGMSYDPGADAPEESVTAGEWIDALCLAVLRDRAAWHGEAFRFARDKFLAQTMGTPVGELATGLMAVVLDDTGDEEEYPPSAGAKLAAADAALDRVRVRAEETGEPLLDRPGSAALRALRALAAEDRESFDAALADLLARHAALHSGPSASPGSLLPLVPLALAALAYRTLGWSPAVRTDYLPHALVTGFETRGPRVAGFGRDRRPDAVAALAKGPLTVERPAPARTVDPGIEDRYEERVRAAFTPVDGEALSVWRLGSSMGDQERLFMWRSAASDGCPDAQLRSVRLASQMGAALFRVALAEPGSDVEVTIDGRSLRYRARRDERTGPGPWHKATAFALITGAREDLAPLVLTGPAFACPDGSAFSAYREALHAYLKGTDPEAAAERALRQAEKAKDWGFAMPPAVLLSQLVEGDAESFNLALADALEAHRAHYQVADRADDPDAAVSLDALALACHARRRGWDIRVESPYLPRELLRAAEPI